MEHETLRCSSRPKPHRQPIAPTAQHSRVESHRRASAPDSRDRSPAANTRRAHATCALTLDALLGLLLQPKRQRADAICICRIEALDVAAQCGTLLVRHIARREPLREAHILRQIRELIQRIKQAPSSACSSSVRSPFAPSRSMAPSRSIVSAPASSISAQSSASLSVHKLRTKLHDALARLQRINPPANAVSRLKHQRTHPAFRQRTRRREPCNPRAEYEHIRCLADEPSDICLCRHAHQDLTCCTSGSPKRSRTKPSAASRVVTVPSSCASSAAVSISRKRGPGL